MTRTLSLILPLFIAILCAACGAKENTTRPQTGYLLVFGEDSCRCIDYDDAPIFAAPYNETSLYYNDLALVQDAVSRKWGYIDDEGEYVLSAIYDRATVFSEGLAWVYKRGDMLGAINSRGDMKISLREVFEVRAFQEGHAAFAVSKKLITYWGFLNKEGEEVIKPQYRAVQDFRNGLAAVQDRATGQWGYIDLSGNTMIQPLYSEVHPFNEDGTTLVRLQDQYVVIDRTGTALKELPHSKILPDNNWLRIEHDGKWGWCDKEGNTTIQPLYDDCRPFGTANLAPVKINGKWAYIDRKGEIVVKRQFTDAYPFFDGCAAVRAGNVWGFIDSDGKYTVNPQYDRLPKDYLQQALGKGSTHTVLDLPLIR